MELMIVRPTSSQTMKINWLEAQTDYGNVVILPGHAPTIILLTQSKEVTIELWDCNRILMTVVSGILQVTRTSITLLITQE